MDRHPRDGPHRHHLLIGAGDVVEHDRHRQQAEAGRHEGIGREHVLDLERAAGSVDELAHVGADVDRLGHLQRVLLDLLKQTVGDLGRRRVLVVHAHLEAVHVLVAAVGGDELVEPKLLDHRVLPPAVVVQRWAKDQREHRGRDLHDVVGHRDVALGGEGAVVVAQPVGRLGHLALAADEADALELAVGDEPLTGEAHVLDEPVANRLVERIGGDSVEVSGLGLRHVGTDHRFDVRAGVGQCFLRERVSSAGHRVCPISGV